MCADTGLELPRSALDAELLQEEQDASEHHALVSHELDKANGVLAAPSDSEELPWCTSQNDARCSKLPAGSVPSLLSFDGAPSLALSTRIALPSPSSIAHDHAEYSCGGPRDAMRSPFERPPQ